MQRKHAIGGLIQRGAGLADLGDPLREVRGGHGRGREFLVLKAHAVELRVFAAQLSLAVGLQIELRYHAGHRVDLAAQRWDEERLHHRFAGQAEVDGSVGRNGHDADGGNALLGIDKEPLPIEADDLDLQWRLAGFRRPIGIQRNLLRDDQKGEDDDDCDRNAPDRKLQRPRE